jgi:hypothetical protein
MTEPTNPNKPEDNNAPKGNEFKDKPRPFTMFRHEAAKTNLVLEQSTQERAAVDNKLAALHKAYVPALEAHGLALKQAGDKRIEVRKEAVDSLTTECGEAQKVIDEMQKKMAEQQAKLARSQGALKTASQEMANEQTKIVKENKASYKAKKGELLKGIDGARQERKGVYSKTGKKIRRERWNTFKRTTREAVCYFPDLAVRFGKATKRGAGEIIHVFSRTAKKAGEGYSEPTTFSIKRDKPLQANPQPPKPDAPKQ